MVSFFEIDVNIETNGSEPALHNAAIILRLNKS